MKITKYEKYLICAMIIILFVVFAINYNTINDSLGGFLEDIIATWGYGGIFVIVFIFETIPQPFISALFAFYAGLFLGLDFSFLLTLTIISAVVANYTAYIIGFIYGEGLIKIFISRKNYNRSTKWFHRYGKGSIALLALTPLPYFPVIGGIFKMSFREFTLYAIIPRLFHFLIFTSFAWFFF